MTRRIGAAGRRALDLALNRVEAGRTGRAPAPARFPIRAAPLPFLQRAAPSPPPASEPQNGSGSQLTPAEGAIERETPSPSPKEIADRVYRLFCQDLRRDRERRGRWR
jgi:hypothetical protein